MRCDIRGPNQTYVVAKFQSLSGFLMRCDLPAWTLEKPPKKGFNPYRVF